MSTVLAERESVWTIANGSGQTNYLAFAEPAIAVACHRLLTRTAEKLITFTRARTGL